jgi:hypothetical protein
MAELRSLVDRTLAQLNLSADEISRKIAKIVQEAAPHCQSGDYMLFHIDDQSWYTAYFHICHGRSMKGDVDLGLPQYLEAAVNEALDLDSDKDEPSLDFFDEVNDKIFDLISQGWHGAGGTTVNIPSFITLHDSNYYFDIAKQKAYSEKGLAFLFKNTE